MTLHLPVWNTFMILSCLFTVAYQCSRLLMFHICILVSICVCVFSCKIVCFKTVTFIVCDKTLLLLCVCVCVIYWCLMLNGKEGVSHCCPQKCGTAVCVTTAYIIKSLHICQLKLFHSLSCLL